MPTTAVLGSLSAEQRELWDRVCQLWELSRDRDRALVDAAIHPQYVGWDMSSDLPHSKEAAMASVIGDAPELRNYTLSPHSIQVYGHVVGVVHYSYEAMVQPSSATPLVVTGKWTEVYLRQNNEWLMVAVSGRPNPSPQGRQPNAEPAT
jgi:hypothetical protein